MSDDSWPCCQPPCSTRRIRRSLDGIADRTASMCAPATTVTSVTPPANSPRITRASTVSPVGPSGKTALARPMRDEAPAARTIARTMV